MVFEIYEAKDKRGKETIVNMLFILKTENKKIYIKDKNILLIEILEDLFVKGRKIVWIIIR